MLFERAGVVATLSLFLTAALSACGQVGNTTSPSQGVAPVITSEPSDQMVPVGATATFAVAANGSTPLTYQWLRNGTSIAGATAAYYSTPVSVADDGASFAARVSNSAGSVQSAGATLTVTAGPVAPTITGQPGDRTVSSGQTASFTVNASGTSPLSYQWRKNGTAIAGATAASYTTPPTTNADNGAQFSVLVSNSAGSVTSRSALLTVTAAARGTDVVTYKYDVSRSGLNPNEKVLTAANVTAATFGKLRFLSTDGKVDAQPLYLSALSIGGSTRNVVYVATENDSVYAFDADTGSQLWQVSLVPAGESVAAVTPTCDEILPVAGITSTPVIDRSAGAIYVIAMSQTISNSVWHHRLYALSLTSGAPLAPPTDITASYPSAGGTITFDPVQYSERAALLLLNRTIYTAWTSHCDNKFYTGWIMAFSQSTLQQSAVLNVAPNSGGLGPAIWMSGGGPAADALGNVYLLTANGVFDQTLDGNGFPSMGDYANSFLKLDTSGGGLKVADYFTLTNVAYESSNDLDLGSGGVLLLPDLPDAAGTVRHLAVGAGKDGHIYVVNRDAMGHFSASGNNIWQQLSGALGDAYTGANPFQGGVWATPAYFNGHLYYGASELELRSYSVNNAKLSGTPSAVTAVDFVYPGTAPSVSANGTSNGIVWAHQNTNPAVLYAFDAGDLHELYDSSQAVNGRDQFGAGNKFITPVVVDGKVFVATTNGVAVFGLL